MAVPYLSTDQLVEAIKRKISFPVDQSTFSNDDLIAFLNEELMISQVPQVMQFHESYFTHIVEIPLLTNVNKYKIPNRAIGMKLNDLMYVDPQNNLSEMTRINDGDKAYFQTALGFNSTIYKFYLQGNYVVLSPDVESNPQGSLQFSIFLRPNQLVTDSRAAIISSFNKKISIVNASIVPGDTITIFDQIFEAGVDFAIGGTSIITATNLVNAINTNGIVVANNGSPGTSIVTLQFENRNDPVDEVETSNDIGFVINPLYTIQFETVPDNITNGSLVDFLQTNPGHQIYDFDIKLSSTAITGTSIDFDENDVPFDLVIGDYVASAHESIIPNLPPELHNMLAEQTCARILSAIGDQQGLQATVAHIQEMKNSQGTLLDNRTENAPKKVLNRTSPLRYGKMGFRRRI